MATALGPKEHLGEGFTDLPWMGAADTGAVWRGLSVRVGAMDLGAGARALGVRTGDGASSCRGDPGSAGVTEGRTCIL